MVPYACHYRRLLLKSRLSVTALLCLFLFTIGPIGRAQALNLQWAKDKFNHISEDQPVEELLRELFASQNLMVSISDKVSGLLVSGRFNDSYKVVFEKLSSAYDLTWYFDGQVMHIFRSNEVTSKMLPLKHLSSSQFEATLDKMGLLNPRFPLRTYPDENIIVASGPKPYVAAIEDAMALIDMESFKADSLDAGLPKVTRIFYLKNAWADDKILFIDTNKVVIQGVASILRDLIGTRKPQRVRASGKDDLNEAELNTRIDPLKPMEEDQADETEDIRRIKRQVSNLGRAGRKTTPPVGDTAVLNPDVTIQTAVRLNAVIIKDNLKNMPFYERIIKELDVPLRLIEIKATIIDIAHDAFESLGVNWAARKSSGGASALISSINIQDGADGGNWPGNSGGLNLTTIISGMADEFFLARVSALEAKGKAKIISRPSIITFDNIESHFKHSNTFYVRVAGEQDASLFQISTGITLKVTPHIIDNSSAPEIQLVVNIEDGAITDERVDGIPVVKNSRINTQAVVREKESLLIGGLIHEDEGVVEHKVPVLGDIPVLGNLFRYKKDEKSKSERLFLITPKVHTGNQPNPDSRSIGSREKHTDSVRAEKEVAQTGTDVSGSGNMADTVDVPVFKMVF